MSRKRQKEKDIENRSAGGLIVSLILALLCALVGFVGGVVHLALIPAQTVRKQPTGDERKPHTVYYVQPTTGSAPSYEMKEQALLGAQRGTITLTAAELNTWAADTFRFAKPPSEMEGSVVMIPSSPKFNFAEDGTLSMAVMLEVKTYGKSHKVLFQTQGTFTMGAEGPEFVPEESYLGSARLPREVVTPLIGDFIYKIFSSAEASWPLQDAWNQLSDVRIEGNTLKLVKG